jgi:cell filamentation protein
LLDQLKREHYLQNLNEDEFIHKLTDYFAELNYIHPFREDNGRATREFIRELIRYNGYEVDWIKVNISLLLEAMVLSVYDTTGLKRVLKVCITKINGMCTFK